MNVGLLIYILCLIFICLGIVFCLIFLWLIFFHIRPLKSNIPLILTCNSYIASLVSSIIALRSTVDTIRGIGNAPIYFEGWNCQINGYLIYVAISSFVYSCILQAIFRLFRVVFYRRKSLYTIRVFSLLILLQWLIPFLANLPLLHYLEFIPSEYRCQIPLTNARACLLLLFLDYLIPGNLMLTIYLCIIRYIRQRNIRIVHRHDVIVLKRTLTIFLMIQFLSIPLVIIWLIYIVGNSLTSLSYQLQALTIGFSQSLFPMALAYSTPQIRERFKCQQRRVQPIVHHRFRVNERPLQQRF